MCDLIYENIFQFVLHDTNRWLAQQRLKFAKIHKTISIVLHMCIANSQRIPLAHLHYQRWIPRTASMRYKWKYTMIDGKFLCLLTKRYGIYLRVAMWNVMHYCAPPKTDRRSLENVCAEYARDNSIALHSLFESCTIIWWDLHSGKTMCDVYKFVYI